MGSDTDFPGGYQGSLRDDVHGTQVSGPVSYLGHPQGQIEFRRVEFQGVLYGVLWWSDAEAAAGWAVADEDNERAMNSGVAWSSLLTDRKELGLSPSEAVNDLRTSQDVHPALGTISDSASTVASLDTLRRNLRERGGS
jgi:hypothetical protein